MERTTCLVAGGGPAGMVLGLLLARAGVEVTVLEKHADFLRDFRGDTVHPTTMALLDELGLGERFAALPQSRVENVALPVGATRDDGDQEMLVVGDLRRLARVGVAHPYIAMVPQWDLLSLLAEAGAAEERVHDGEIGQLAGGRVEQELLEGRHDVHVGRTPEDADRHVRKIIAAG